METDDDASETVMDAQQLRSILSPLVRLGSHTVDHPRMSRLSVAEQRDQLIRSRAALEELSGDVIDTLASPKGIALLNAHAARDFVMFARSCRKLFAPEMLALCVGELRLKRVIPWIYLISN